MASHVFRSLSARNFPRPIRVDTCSSVVVFICVRPCSSVVVFICVPSVFIRGRIYPCSSVFIRGRIYLCSVRVHPWSYLSVFRPCSSVVVFICVRPCSSVVLFFRVRPCSSVVLFFRVTPWSLPRLQQQEPERRQRQTERLIVAVRRDSFGEDRAAVADVGTAIALGVAV